MKFIVVFLLTLSLAFGQVANIIPSNERVDWTYGTNTGVPGGIPVRTTISATLSVGASAATIQAALNAALPNTVVYLPSGDYTINTPLYLPDGVVLRGAGESTRLLSSITTDNAPVVSFGTSASTGSEGTITAGFSKGSVSLTFSGGTPPVTGSLMSVKQADESFVMSEDGGNDHVSGTYYVSNVTGNVATIHPGLVWGNSSFSPRFRIQTATISRNAGLESLSIVPTSHNYNPVQFLAAYGCWASRVKVSGINENGFYLIAAVHCDIAHCKVIGVAGTGDGYGIEPTIDTFYETGGVTACAFYDNIFDGLYHGVLASRTQGCLFAYNYSVNEHANSGVQVQTSAFNGTHAAEGMMCLWEGNYGNSITFDKIHGAAAYQTIWRNRFHGMDAYVSVSIPDLATSRRSMIELTTGSYYVHAVGNVLGDTWSATHDANHVYIWTAAGFDAASSSNFGGIFMLGYVGYSQILDVLVANTATLYNNYSYYQGAAQNTGAYSVDASLAWPAAPDWWGNLAWPAYDPGSPIVYGDTAAKRIPAGYRYITGSEPPTGGGDTTPPTPDPATISGTPTHTSTSITVTATTATDETALGSTPYRFSNDNGSSWTTYQLSATYMWTGLTPSTLYNVKVQYQDAAANAGTASSASAVTTDAASSYAPKGTNTRYTRGSGRHH